MYLQSKVHGRLGVLGATAFKIMGLKSVIEFSLVGSPVMETQGMSKIVQVSREIYVNKV